MNTQKSIKAAAITAIFTAVIAVCSQISIMTPFGIPITLQTFAVALCGFFLKHKTGVAAMGVYTALGAIGIPVFSSFTGGIAVLLGKTGGFIAGFFVLALFCGISQSLKNKPFRLCLILAGLILCHLLGIIWFSAITGSDFLASAAAVSLPFIIKDILSVTAALYVSKRLTAVIYY